MLDAVAVWHAMQHSLANQVTWTCKRANKCDALGCCTNHFGEVPVVRALQYDAVGKTAICCVMQWPQCMDKQISQQFVIPATVPIQHFERMFHRRICVSHNLICMHHTVAQLARGVTWPLADPALMVVYHTHL